LRKLYIFLITYCKRFHPKNPFYEKMKMTKKRVAFFESFVIIGSFDCDCTYVQGYIEKNRSRFLWKIGLSSLSSKKCIFCMQNFWSNTHEGLMKNCVHGKLDPNNYRYCEIGSWTKYTHEIVLYISPRILLIQAWKWWCKMDLFDIHPYQCVWWKELHLNKK
jgi:hypothetical protein